MTSPTAEPGSSPTPLAQAVTEVLPTDQFSQYLLRARSEMFTVFLGLAAHVSQITMIFNEGRDMVLTSLISWSDDGLVLDFGASAEMNGKALKAGKLFCVTQLEKVKIQFILRGLTTVQVDGRPAFLAALPDSILRLQRREYYRLAAPVARPLVCRLQFPVVDAPSHLIEARVSDISVGGVCLVGLPLSLPLETDMELPGSTIELPDIGSIIASLRLCALAENASRSGIRTRRAGCEFVNLSRPMATLIQRYIFKTERERKSRESGLA
jgi:c-di-GMP-binding flagellar brake protein YcgR